MSNNIVSGPVLVPDLWFGVWKVKGTGDAWICCEDLPEFFVLPDGTARIRLFSSSRERRDTWKVRFTGGQLLIVGDTPKMTYPALDVWLKKQIGAGRPHIGIEILEVA